MQENQDRDETKVYKSDDLRSGEDDAQNRATGPLLLIERKMLDAFRASNEDGLQGHSSK